MNKILQTIQWTFICYDNEGYDNEHLLQHGRTLKSL